MFFHLWVSGYFELFPHLLFSIGDCAQEFQLPGCPVGLWILKTWGKQSAACGPPILCHPGALQTAEKIHPAGITQNLEKQF